MIGGRRSQIDQQKRWRTIGQIPSGQSDTDKPVKAAKTEWNVSFQKEEMNQALTSSSFKRSNMFFDDLCDGGSIVDFLDLFVLPRGGTWLARKIRARRRAPARR